MSNTLPAKYQQFLDGKLTEAELLNAIATCESKVELQDLLKLLPEGSTLCQAVLAALAKWASDEGGNNRPRPKMR